MNASGTLHYYRERIGSQAKVRKKSDIPDTTRTGLTFADSLSAFLFTVACLCLSSVWKAKSPFHFVQKF